ncbi:MAG: hypothetical protein KME15_21330 [Drouetiella hepatica Uher 2000/2452]|uniref:Uncharacterized protein n=1 Tax=Drouetiella hepatica Uher 2000/2452 TaxID=904376 RepID=A0A951QEF8_9CYAN|nr:hypothetical protein [Drouetiella hepatica Uher 2000/2452]
MRISLERSGGFIGIPMTMTIDTDALPMAEVIQLRKWVDAANIDRLPAHIPSPGNQTDRFRYELVIEDKGQRHTLCFGETAMPSVLKPLVDWMMRSR